MITTLQHTNYDRLHLNAINIKSIDREIDIKSLIDREVNTSSKKVSKTEFYKNHDKIETKINKIDITQYGEISELYRFKTMKYYRTKEFETDFLNDPNNYKLEIIVIDKTKYPIKNNNGVISGISIINPSKRVITISYYSQSSKEVYSTTKVYYNKILYSEYAYNMQDYAKDWKDFEKFSQFKCGPLFENITGIKNLDIYNGNIDKILNYHDRYNKLHNQICLSKFSKNDFLPKYYPSAPIIDNKPYKTCHLNGSKYNKIRYNPYADIEEYYDSNNSYNNSYNKNFITTYGITWSTTINNYYTEDKADKKVFVTRYTNTDDLGNTELDISISGTNALVSLQVGDKKIKLDNVVGYKIVEVVYQNEKRKAVLQLDIPSVALVATDGGDKFRCNKCIPTNVFIALDGELKEIDVSECKACIHSCDFTYYINKECVVYDFDGDLNSVCVPGIHYYYSKEKAIANYGSSELRDAINSSSSGSSSDSNSDCSA